MEKRVIPAGNALDDALEVLFQEGPFDHGMAALRENGLELITAKQLAIVRMADSPRSPLGTNGTLVAENYNYGNGRDAEIVIASAGLNPILKQPVEATNAHRQGKDFYLSDAAWKQLRDVAESDPYKAIKSGALLVTREALKSEIPVEIYGRISRTLIPVEALGETPETVFLFREQAKAYGNWLKARGIRTVPQFTASEDYAKEQDQPFASFLLVRSRGRSINYSSGLVSYWYRKSGLTDCRVTAVHVVSAELVAPEAPLEANGVVAPTLDQVLAVADRYTAGINQPALRRAITKLYRQK